MLFEWLKGGIGIHAIILAAGRGSRMGALSESIPKGLIPLAGKTILTRLLDVLAESGVHSIHVGVGWKHDLFEKHLHAIADSYSMSIEMVEVSSIEKGPLHTLSSVLDHYDNESFLICPVDYVVSPSIVMQLIEQHESGGNSRMLTISVTSESSNDSPTYIRDDGLVAGIGASLMEFDSVYHSAMLVAANPDSISHFRAAHASGEKTVVAAINQMISQRLNVYAAKVAGKWADIDSIIDLLDVMKLILSEQVEPIEGCIIVPPGDTIEIDDQVEIASGTLLASGVSITGPAFIGPECSIEEGCRIGPCVSMENDTKLSQEATIENCLLIESARVKARDLIKDAIVYGSKIISKESD
ncbi:MAG: NTP transferase domain-containing protein [Candidatus Thorarchaeota archaeon]